MTRRETGDENTSIVVVATTYGVNLSMIFSNPSPESRFLQTELEGEFARNATRYTTLEGMLMSIGANLPIKPVNS